MARAVPWCNPGVARPGRSPRCSASSTCWRWLRLTWPRPVWWPWCCWCWPKSALGLLSRVSAVDAQWHPVCLGIQRLPDGCLIHVRRRADLARRHADSRRNAASVRQRPVSSGRWNCSLLWWARRFLACSPGACPSLPGGRGRPAQVSGDTLDPFVDSAGALALATSFLRCRHWPDSCLVWWVCL